MADARRRELERATRQGDQGAALQLLGELLRGGSGVARERLELAAFLLQPAGLELLDAPLGVLPSDRYRSGAEVPLQTVSRHREASLRATLTCLDPTRDAARLEVGGYFGSRSAPWYEDLLREVAQLGVRRLLLDLRRCAGINSGGIGALLRLHQALELQEGLLVVRFQQPVQVVIDMLGLRSFLSIAASDDEATRLLGAGPDGAPVLDGDAWLGRLLRWGTEPCLSAAVAVARSLDQELRPEGAVALRQACAWADEPGPERAEAARLAADAAWDDARALTPQEGRAGWWAYRAAGLAATGIWPGRTPEPLPAQLTKVRTHLLGWALGLD